MAYDYGGCPMLLGYGGYGGYAMIGMIIWISVIIGIIFLVFWLIRNNSIGNTSVVSKNESPMEILKKRYAAGELTKKQFEEMKEELHKK
ncbi:MAG: SHOCT domain-containing protein [Nanoarchaeota archaeon]|nr:SHOCT domain-containing protein [Nanoarchaeota archaeon]